MSQIDIETIEPLNNTTCKVKRFIFSKEDTRIWKTYNFWIETAIFIISVVGAVCIAFGVFKGFLLWFVSNSIGVGYFLFRKQYPLALQQLVFLITSILSIIHYSDDIF